MSRRHRSARITREQRVPIRVGSLDIVPRRDRPDEVRRTPFGSGDRSGRGSATVGSDVATEVDALKGRSVVRDPREVGGQARVLTADILPEVPNLGSAGLVRRLSNARDAQATVA